MVTRTLTAATVIDLPCSDELGCEDGCQDWGPHTFAVCVVDGERRMSLSFDGSPDTDTGWGPPVWLTEPCKTCHGSTFVGSARTNGIRHCPDCIDGRPAVKVYEGRCDDDHRCCLCGGYLGRGTVEHVLPVTLDFDVWDHDHVLVEDDPSDGPPHIWMFDKPGHSKHVIPLDIDVAPGQYVVLVRMEEA